MLIIIKILPKYPHAALICGQTRCGQTEFVLNLLSLQREKGGYLKYFEYIVIQCPTIAENGAYQNRKCIWNDDRVYIDDLRDSTLHKTLEIYHESLKGDETLFIIDDCSATKELKYRKHENDNNSSMISELAFSCRHANHSCWILSQKYNSVLKDFREQLKWLCIFYCKDRHSFKNCLRENDVVENEETRKEICLKLKKIKHSKLLRRINLPITSYTL